jgi:hypothetical protein
LAETFAVQLDRVQQAIAAIESGSQSFTILNRSFTQADLATLYRRERELKSAIARQTRGGIRVQRIIPL